MRPTTTLSVLVIAVVALLVASQAAAQDSAARDSSAQNAAARARNDYESAMRDNDARHRMDLLRRSFDALPTFEASIAASEALLSSRGDALDARRWAERAYGL